jgi:hypothetical protein
MNLKSRDKLGEQLNLGYAIFLLFAISVRVIMILAPNLAVDNLFFHAQLGQHCYHRHN